MINQKCIIIQTWEVYWTTVSHGDSKSRQKKHVSLQNHVDMIYPSSVDTPETQSTHGSQAIGPKVLRERIGRFSYAFFVLERKHCSYFLSYCDIIGYNYQLDIVYASLSKTRVYIESIGMSSWYSALILWVIYPIFSYTQLNWRAPNCLPFATEIGVCFQASSSRLVSFLGDKIFWGC